MRILFWATSYLPFIGGLEVFCHSLITQLMLKGHKIVVFAYDCVNEKKTISKEEYEGVIIHRLPYLKQYSIAELTTLLSQLKSIIQEFKPDLIHIHGFGPSAFYQSFVLPNYQEVPKILTVHGLYEDLDYNLKPFKMVLECMDYITTVSHALSQEFVVKISSLTKPLCVIYNGIECRQSIEIAPLRNDDTTNIIIASRISKEKGIDVAINAMKFLREKSLKVHLKIYGDDNPTTQHAQYLHQLTDELDLSKYISFHSSFSRQCLAECLTQASVILIPSRYESFGLVALEAGLLKIPVIASDVGGLQEVIMNNQTGLLVPSEDPQALADAIITVIENSELKNRLIGNAYKHVINNFSIEKTADEYEKLYKKLMQIPEPVG